jgi:hypothetical protein
MPHGWCRLISLGAACLGLAVCPSRGATAPAPRGVAIAGIDVAATYAAMAPPGSRQDEIPGFSKKAAESIIRRMVAPPHGAIRLVPPASKRGTARLQLELAMAPASSVNGDRIDVSVWVGSLREIARARGLVRAGGKMEPRPDRMLIQTGNAITLYVHRMELVTGTRAQDARQRATAIASMIEKGMKDLLAIAATWATLPQREP